MVLQKKEQKDGSKTSVHSVELTEDFSHNDLVNLLLSTGRSRSNGLTFMLYKLSTGKLHSYR